MEPADRISRIAKAGVSLHGLAICDPLMRVPDPVRLAAKPTDPGRWWAAGQAVDAAAPPEATGLNRFVLETVDLFAARATEPHALEKYFRLVQGIPKAELAEYLVGPALSRLTSETSSGAFLPEHYRATYPKVVPAAGHGETSYLHHYVLHGSPIGNNPNPYFREKYYLNKYPDVRGAVERGDFVSGFHHFLSAGRTEGRFYRPRETKVAVDLTFLAERQASGPFVGYAISILVAIIRLFQAVEFTLLIPEAFLETFRQWDAENVSRQAVPTDIRRPARELLAQRPDFLVSVGRPSLFRGEERASLIVAPDPLGRPRVRLSGEGDLREVKAVAVAFAGPIDALQYVLDEEGAKLPFAVQMCLTDEGFGALAAMLRNVFLPAGPFGESREIIGADEHGNIGYKGYLNVRNDRKSGTVAVLMHCPADRPPQAVCIRVRDESGNALSEKTLTVFPGQYRWEEIGIPSGLVQIEFGALAPKKAFVDGRWRVFSSIQLVEVRKILREESRIEKPGQAGLSRKVRLRNGIYAFEFDAGYKGSALASDIRAVLSRLSSTFPAYRTKAKLLGWNEDLVRRPRFLIVSPLAATSAERQSLDHKTDCLTRWAEAAGFATAVRRSDFAPEWFRARRLEVKWREIACCVLLAPATPDAIGMIREINEDLILFSYHAERTEGRASPRGGALTWLRSALQREPGTADEAADYAFLDHRGVLQRGGFTPDSTEAALCYLPSYIPDEAAETAQPSDVRTVVRRDAKSVRRCGLFFEDAASLRRALRSTAWTATMSGLVAANPDWRFCYVLGVAEPPAGELDTNAALRFDVVTLDALRASPGEIPVMLFSESEPGRYVDVLVECLSQSINCIVDTAVRAKLPRELFVHTASTTLHGPGAVAAHLDDLVFDFDGAAFTAALKTLFDANLRTVFGRLAQEKFGDFVPVIPKSWT